MDSTEIPPVSQIPIKPLDQTTSINVKQLQPVPTSGGCDLAQDLIWQRDPDCSKDPVLGHPINVSPGQTVTAAPTKFPVSTDKQPLPQGTSHYHYQIPENQTLPGNNATLVQAFPPPTMYTGLSAQDVITYVPVSGTPTVVMDTDGNRIQQNPGVQQNIAFAGFQMPHNIIPAQYQPNMAASVNANPMQYVSMQPPSPIVQQQLANYSYPRLVPYNPQTMTLPKPLVAQQPIAQKPTTLNVTLANQVAQNSISVNVVGTQVTSPMMTSPIGQSPTSVASPSVKSPTYVYMCNKCDYVTPYRSSFKTHYCSHIQYKPYQCAYCDHSSIMKQPMQKHVKMKHAIEDSEGFTYESDQKKESIIEYICKLCRSTMNMEEAKKFYEKFEGSHERLKSGKRKINKDSEEDETVTPTKRKKKFSWSDGNVKEDGDEDDSHYSSNVRGTSKSPISPRKLTHWKEDSTLKPSKERGHTKIKKPGRPKKYADGELTALRKTLVGKVKKFPGFRKQKKYLSQNFNASTFLCQFCEFKSASQKGLKKHCEWRHPEKKRKCAKCSFASFFEEEFTTHVENNQCKNEQNILAVKQEGTKSPVKRFGRPRKSLLVKSKSPAVSIVMDEDIPEGANNDDAQLNCPHCNFISHPFALKRHLFFYHKECDWRCKHCGFISSSKKEVVRHSNKVHADAQPNVVQTFADISSLLHELATEQEKSDMSDGEKIVIKHQLTDSDYINLSKRRLVLGKKRGPKTMNNSQLGVEDKLQMIKVAGLTLKRGRKREEKSGNDQNSFVVRPKKLKIARIGFSCVYCTYAAPLRHQLRLHCYEKHTKHPACLMEFVNSKTVILEDDEHFPSDSAENNKRTEQNLDPLKAEIKNNSDESLLCEQNMKETTVKSMDQSESEFVEPMDKKTSEDLEVNTTQADDNDDQSKESLQMDIDTAKDPILKLSENNVNVSLIEKSGTEEMEVSACESENQGDTKIESTTSNDEQEQKKEVMSCMENILNSISRNEGLDVNGPSANNYGAFEQKSVSCILPNKMNGHKFSNPFSTLIIQLNSTEIKVRDAFEGSLDDVDIYLEKFGVRTLNMDSLTPKQFEVFMRKFGNSLQPLTL